MILYVLIVVAVVGIGAVMWSMRGVDENFVATKRYDDIAFGESVAAQLIEQGVQAICSYEGDNRGGKGNFVIVKTPEAQAMKVMQVLPEIERDLQKLRSE